MIFIIDKEIQNVLSASVIAGNRSNIVSELLLNPDKDVIILEDDLENQIRSFDYLGLRYKCIIGVPGVSNTKAVMFIKDSNNLIDYDSFKKEFSHLISNSNSVELDDVLSGGSNIEGSDEQFD